MKATDNFFDKKRSWSKLKDEILISYLTPYLTKISHTSCPITIADCFAGKGMFDDGQLGSPLHIAKAIENFTQQQAPKVDVQGVFVEQKYFKELQKNLCSFVECELIDSDFEKWANELGAVFPVSRFVRLISSIKSISWKFHCLCAF